MNILEQRLSLITLGVADLDRAFTFYTDVLGWTPEGDNPGIVFFNLGGYLLALYPHSGLAEDMTLEAGPGGTAPQGYRGFTLAYITRSREEVDAIFAKLKAAGATILKSPQQVFWGGYSGYFLDPDGHAWEIAHNPFKVIDDEGRVLPK
jgi:catechol 2,3-dioxygenase-like lactoylglutathione lyase family enzyme